MYTVISVFSTRRDAMALYDYCLRRRIAARIVNTPRQISASCGISVQTAPDTKDIVQKAAAQLVGYVGSYAVRNFGTHQSIVRLQ